MVLNDMAKKKEMSDAFTYHYEVNAANQLVALFWCDGLMKKNYHMFGDIVAFDSTYNTNRYCMIFTPFTGKDNHGKPVTFTAGLVCNKKTGAFGWLFKHFVEDEFEEEWNGVVERYELEDVNWLNTLYEYRQMWIPAYFRDFPLGSMIRTTSISELENSFYKNFMKPRANLAELYLNFNNALEFQRNARTKLDYNNATVVPILATKLAFEKHASTIYTDSMFRKIQEEIVDGNDRCRVLGFSSTDMVDTYKLGDSRRNSEYCDSRWMKTPLAKTVHGQFDATVDTRSTVDDWQTVSNQGISLFYDFLRRFETDIDVLRAFVGGLEELGHSLQAGTPPTSAFEKRRMIEEFYGMLRPEVLEVHHPDVVKTKGHASNSASRLISKREKAIKEATRPLRRCKACDELGHHDSRNCPMLKEIAKEKELRKGKRKC
ncbi:protein FAR-RED IMPAIRED RESPONSE 1-like [Salvia hispanica]|uniref:protein FAR-RED IMPAIRED RESPONSE 1-like n=1 Tax=Salvia hispanica TaxID=49212 RepID=UPI0020090F90|nr:protein FAR-RED IMPAIRED RESPONSE 1-like [Salvia hispanica]